MTQVGSKGNPEEAVVASGPAAAKVPPAVEAVVDYQEICRLLPHRTPLILVDRVVGYTVGDSLLAYKAISGHEPVFAGHFPGQPIFPGVYIVEGLAQASALLTFKTYEAEGVAYKHEVLLASVDQVRLRRPVVPGDVLYYRVKLRRRRGPWAWFVGQAEVGGEVVATASFSARTVIDS
jgi:3-hydroxyacyl-[acyl-carrier-protein] dehydratase